MIIVLLLGPYAIRTTPGMGGAISRLRRVTTFLNALINHFRIDGSNWISFYDSSSEIVGIPLRASRRSANESRLEMMSTGFVSK